MADNATDLFFSNWRELNSHLIWVYRGRPIRSVGRFDAKQLSAWLIMRGTLSIGEKIPETIGSGNWVFASHKNVSREFSDDAEILSVKFDMQWPDGLTMFEHEHVLTVASSKFPDLERAALAMLRSSKRWHLSEGNMMQFQSLSLRQFLRMNQLFQAWLLAYVGFMEHVGQQPRYSRHEDARMMKAKELIDAHPLSVRLSLTGLASRIGLSFGHADTLFHATFGQTMRSYFDLRRYLAAQHWLEHSGKPIKEIAYELGFNDSTAFTHWFRKKSGFSPTAYRRAKA
ncbi:helix-turn-helix domain-containing protein [Cerasicoccus fimbriatus]|uniref:helix-turn-helix domain-containing protein n=1 Tax=Cerasicoccus fimbriatus TaxID=3014554 RepID=UPI0022B3CAB1|nr:AraC family transcriptional regulator [Cerasicoccus sp. TK19100]